MRQLGLEEFAIDIRSLEKTELESKVDELLDRHQDIVDHLHSAVPALQKRSRETTDLAVALLARA
jgi:hypothetical protein